MTGPEHYREAEEHLRFALDSETDDGTQTHCAIAQVHAMLALAAATAGQTSIIAFQHDINDVDVDNWRQVAGPMPTGGAERG